MRAVDDVDQSSILGISVPSQVYIFADYQETRLSTALANDTLRFLTHPDNLQCIEHSNSTGSLGWTIISPADLVAASTASSTTSLVGPQRTRKTSAAVRFSGSLEFFGILMLSLAYGLHDRGIFEELT